MIYRAFCEWARIREKYNPGEDETGQMFMLKPGGNHPSGVFRIVSNVTEDDRAMRKLVSLTIEERNTGFDRLRRDYPLRSDFRAWQVIGTSSKNEKSLQG